MTCERCGGPLMVSWCAPGDDPSCLYCGWVRYPPDDLAASLAAAETDNRAGSGGPRRRRQKRQARLLGAR